MKKKVMNLRMTATLLATAIVLMTNWGVALAEYHHVASCTVCHDMHGGGDCGDYTNLRLIFCELPTPNSGPMAVKFTCDFSGEFPCDPVGTNSYADGDTTYDGVCEVCHTETKYHLNDGSGEDHYTGQYCIQCHSHADEFSHGGGAGVGCDACHGHDEGYEYEPGKFSEGDGTVQAHSTHTEDDADDLKGPFINCGDCHDIENYPYFKSGTDTDADGQYDLSETNVCDDCHSPGGGFPESGSLDDPGVGAKANWKVGGTGDDNLLSNIYEENGVTLRAGKDKWCATCHDNVPAYSQPPSGSSVVEVVDTPDIECSDWVYRTEIPESYGEDHYYHAAGDGSCTATWTPDIPQTGNYNVYAWWRAHANCATNAKYTVHYDGGVTDPPIKVNQEIDGSQWNYLGNYPFVAGTSGSVVLTDNANEYVIADAIKFESGGPVVPGIYAPNVIGDNTTYGFYATGHKINCLSCHDAGKKHFDHEHRTYEADESTGEAINPYADSYRLQGTNSMPSTALCLDCHNGNEVLGEDRWDVSHTNFWNNNPTISYIGNAHNYHMGLGYVHFDSDWDGVKDSRESCIACHNVHGSSYKTMIRDGKLISSYGTTDKEPALNFSYLVESTAPTATATWPVPDDGTYYVYAWWAALSNRATNAPYTINHTGGTETFEVNQEINGGQWNQLGAGPYTFVDGTVVLSNEGANEYVIADAIGFDSDGIFDPDPEIVIDNDDPTVSYSPEEWPSGSNSPDKYGADVQYYAKQDNLLMDPDATLQESVGARMDLAGGSIYHNGVCGACHTGISWERTPYLGPKVIDAKADPKTIAAPEGETNVLLTAFVFDHNDNVSNVTVDLLAIEGNSTQTMYDDGTNGDLTADDNIYSFETTVPADVGSGFKSLMVTATDPDGDGKGEIVLQVTIPGEIIMDTPDIKLTCSDWVYRTGIPESYGDDHYYHAAGDGLLLCTATWTTDIPETGDYKVYAWWRVHENWATNAKYTVHYDGGVTDPPIEVNQEIDGGQWYPLGTWHFLAGDSYSVVLSDDANDYVVADAIKWELQQP